MTPRRTAGQGAEFAAGLRELADFIEAHPGLPVPARWQQAAVGPHLNGTDEEDRAEVDRIAGILDAAPITTVNGHYKVRREFSGGVTYEAIAIPDTAMKRWEALTSYAGAVQPAGGAR